MELQAEQTPHQQGHLESKKSDDEENTNGQNEQKLHLPERSNTEEDNTWKWCVACQCQFTTKDVSSDT